MNLTKGILFITCMCCLCVSSTGKHTLYVGALLELTNHWYAEYTSFFITILEHAFEEIEQRTDLLADYSLQLITKDTQVSTLCTLETT